METLVRHDPSPSTPDLQHLLVGSRNLLGGPEGKMGFKNKKTRALLLWFLEGTDGMQTALAQVERK